MAQISFDASGVEPAVPFELLPPGKYRAQIVQSEMQATKQGDGQMLWLEFDVLDGPFQGRKVWERLNLVNRNQTTVEIAQRQLSAICHAVDRIQVTDSEQLHFRPLLLTVAVEMDKRDEHLPVGQQRKQNRVKGYAKAPGAPMAAVTAATRAVPAAPAAVSTTASTAAPTASPTVATAATPPAATPRPATAPWRSRSA